MEQTVPPSPTMHTNSPKSSTMSPAPPAPSPNSSEKEASNNLASIQTRLTLTQELYNLLNSYFDALPHVFTLAKINLFDYMIQGSIRARRENGDPPPDAPQEEIDAHNIRIRSVNNYKANRVILLKIYEREYQQYVRATQQRQQNIVTGVNQVSNNGQPSPNDLLVQPFSPLTSTMELKQGLNNEEPNSPLNIPTHVNAISGSVHPLIQNGSNSIPRCASPIQNVRVVPYQHLGVPNSAQRLRGVSTQGKRGRGAGRGQLPRAVSIQNAGIIVSGIQIPGHYGVSTLNQSVSNPTLRSVLTSSPNGIPNPAQSVSNQFHSSVSIPTQSSIPTSTPYDGSNQIQRRLSQNGVPSQTLNQYSVPSPTQSPGGNQSLNQYSVPSPNQYNASNQTPLQRSASFPTLYGPSNQTQSVYSNQTQQSVVPSQNHLQSQIQYSASNQTQYNASQPQYNSSNPTQYNTFNQIQRAVPYPYQHNFPNPNSSSSDVSHLTLRGVLNSQASISTPYGIQTANPYSRPNSVEQQNMPQMEMQERCETPPTEQMDVPQASRLHPGQRQKQLRGKWIP